MRQLLCRESGPSASPKLENRAIFNRPWYEYLSILIELLLDYVIIVEDSGGSRISQEGGTNIGGGGANLLFGTIFVGNCMKMKKEMDRDPPLEKKHICERLGNVGQRFTSVRYLPSQHLFKDFGESGSNSKYFDYYFQIAGSCVRIICLIGFNSLD